MRMQPPTAAVPATAVDEESVLAGLPAVPRVRAAEVAAAVAASGLRLVVLDDDPTGTQTVAGVPVLTGWNVADLCWAMRQDASAFYVSTNTRSLTPADVEARIREIAVALAEASEREGIGYVIASRGDSTLRGHYPLETDVLTDALGRTAGVHVDGVVVAPAYIEGGRLTVDSVHWMRTIDGLLPVGRSEFARDATFGYRSSDLRDYVEEKTGGRWKAADVARITLRDLREGGTEAVVAILATLTDGRPVVADAVCDEDLRVLSLGIVRAENAGSSFVYQVGPSFVRARAGLQAHPPLTAVAVDAFRRAGRKDLSASHAMSHGLVVVGSHVGMTTRQLERLSELEDISEIELDVARLLDPNGRAEAIASTVAAAMACIEQSDVVVHTSRALVAGGNAEASLAIARSVSSALVEVVRALAARCTPRWVVAKGGITASDIAVHGLEIRRAWVRGTLLPGIVSLWDPVVSSMPGIPYVVFAGNVGDDGSLAAVVTKLRGGS